MLCVLDLCVWTVRPTSQLNLRRNRDLSTMLRLSIRLGLILLVLNQGLTPSTALRNRGSGYGKGNKDPSQPKTLAGTSSGLPSQNAARRGLGISAWGLVLLIVGLIVAVMGLYYFSVCYPMCQNHSTSHKYDKMSLPTMA